LSGFLLDTNVVSMLSPSKTGAASPFRDWLRRMDAQGQIFLSAVTIHELEKGIALLQHKGASAKAASLRFWLSGLAATYDDKILPLNTQAAALAGQLEAKAIAAGHNPGMADAAVAGIAKTSELVVVTNNMKHFMPFGISVTSPDDAAGSA